MQPMLVADISEVVRDAWDAISGFLGDFVSAIMDTTIAGWLIELIKTFVLFILTWSDDMYDKLVNKAYALLTENPQTWSPDAWNIVKGINDTAISTIGISLVVVFFAIGFCKNSLDPVRDLRFENILKMFIKLSVASWFMYNSIHIVAAMFDLVSILTGGNAFASKQGDMSVFFENTYNSITINGAQPGNVGMGALLATALVSLIYAITSIAVGAMILYQAFTRFFKILVIIPYGSIASTTLAGDHQTAHSAASFYKYALNCILEAATMIIAMFVYAKLSDKLPQGLGLYQDPAATMGDVGGRMITELILMMTMYGVIKQSSVMTQRALGL